MDTSDFNMSPTVDDTMIEDFLVDAASTWAIHSHSTNHTVLKSTPGAAIFGRDMILDIPCYTAHWNEIGCRRQEQVERTNKCRTNNVYPTTMP